MPPEGPAGPRPRNDILRSVVYRRQRELVVRRREGAVDAVSEKTTRRVLTPEARQLSTATRMKHVEILRTVILHLLEHPLHIMAFGTPIFVHRCRFVDFQPAAITALAFPPLPLPRPSLKGKEKARWTRGYKFGTLVVGRANGDIELGEWTGDTRGNVNDVEAAQAWVVRKASADLSGLGDRQLLIQSFRCCLGPADRKWTRSPLRFAIQSAQIRMKSLPAQTFVCSAAVEEASWLSGIWNAAIYVQVSDTQDLISC